MTEVEYEKLLILWLKELQQIREYKGFTPRTLYNAYQTGLFYQKMPNSLYTEKGGNKYFMAQGL